MMKELRESEALGLLAASVTMREQLECVPRASVLRVMVLLPDVAAVVLDEQSPV